MQNRRPTFTNPLTRRQTLLLAAGALLLLAYAWCLPRPLFQDPYCFVLEDRSGQLLGARIAADGQWRFPPIDSVPDKFARCLVQFEDHRFYSHPGVDPLAIGRALRQNLREGHIVSGGSTLSMQVVRLSRKGQRRTVVEKIIEAVLATRLELRHSKAEILAMYASHAPFGGNVVGLDAATWRYYGKSSHQLSWAEAATLAVLPNSPSLVRPGRGQAKLLEKRNRLLAKMLNQKQLDSTTYRLALAEPLPGPPQALPQLAPHLLDKAIADQAGKSPEATLTSTLDAALQRQLLHLASRHLERLRQNEIHNLALLVLHVPTGEVRGYIGNAPGTGQLHGGQVDIVQAPRSTGSILKPLLYCEALRTGEIGPTSFLSDVPTYINGYRPQNYHDNYDGVVPADRALSRSLNVPFVLLLQQHGTERFHFLLQKLGLRHINRPASDYGLSLILGGAETSLWDITSTYAALGRRLGGFYDRQGQYTDLDFRPAEYLKHQRLVGEPEQLSPSAGQYFGAGEIWLTLQALRQLERPTTEGNWQRFEDAPDIAWKTGTSFGFRDAWAIGLSPEYAVGVWAGNADGEGRPGLTGTTAAAPLLFDVWKILPSSEWFLPPYDALRPFAVCAESGFAPTVVCPVDSILLPAETQLEKTCMYHRRVFLDATATYRADASCYPAAKLQDSTWLVLPPVEAHYFRQRHPTYRTLPPYLPGCSDEESAGTNTEIMEFVYPKNLTTIRVPLELDGSPGKVVFQVVHQEPHSQLHWHFDGAYQRTTRDIHEFQISPPAGEHTLVVVDGKGRRLAVDFDVVGR